MGKIHLVTFGGGLQHFREAASRVERQARRSGFFDEIHAYTDVDLFRDDVFQRRHGDFVSRNYGYGYWIWKPYLIGKTLENAAEGDVVFYCDAGCEINPLGANTLRHYAGLVDASSVLLFRMPPKYASERWTKGDLLLKFPALIGQGQITAATLGVRADNTGKAFIQSWYNLCCQDDYRFLDGSPSHVPNHEKFEGHYRHDQCCLSAAALSFDPAILPNYPEFSKFRNRAKQPIVVNRSKSGKQKIWTFSMFQLAVMFDVTKFDLARFVLPRIIALKQGHNT